MDLEEFMNQLAGHGAAGQPLEDVLRQHGLVFDADGESAVVGEVKLLHCRLGDERAAASGRTVVHDMPGFYEAADVLEQPASELAARLMGQRADDDDFDPYALAPDVLDAIDLDFDILSDVLILSEVWVAPLLRGHRIGSWAAAQAITSVASPECLVAATAAPLHKEDGAPDYVSGEMTAEQSARWSVEQSRLAKHWSDGLGFRPLASDPNTLVFYTGSLNDALEASLGHWR